jgi:hypothetical protein
MNVRHGFNRSGGQKGSKQAKQLQNTQPGRDMPTGLCKPGVARSTDLERHGLDGLTFGIAMPPQLRLPSAKSPSET